MIDAFTWTVDPQGRAAALAALVRDLYETTEWRLQGTEDAASELAGLHGVLLAVDAHARRMSPQVAGAVRGRDRADG